MLNKWWPLCDVSQCPCPNVIVAHTHLFYFQHFFFFLTYWAVCGTLISDQNSHPFKVWSMFLTANEMLLRVLVYGIAQVLFVVSEFIFSFYATLELSGILNSNSSSRLLLFFTQTFFFLISRTVLNNSILNLG